jgi:hypothetical protein
MLAPWSCSKSYVIATSIMEGELGERWPYNIILLVFGHKLNLCIQCWFGLWSDLTFSFQYIPQNDSIHWFQCLFFHFSHIKNLTKLVEFTLRKFKKSKFYQLLCWKIAKFCFKNTICLSRKTTKLITITCKKCSWFLKVGLNFSPFFYLSKIHMLTPSYVMLKLFGVERCVFVVMVENTIRWNVWIITIVVYIGYRWI